MSSTSTRLLPLQRQMRIAREAAQAYYMPALFIGLCYMAITTMWTLYSAYVPVMLQVDFGLRATAIGLVMMLDNLLALLVQPWIGARSDRLRSRWGRRLPFIVAGMPLAAAGFALIPLAGDLFQGLPGFVATVMVMLISMAAMRVPLFALMPDLTAPERRSTANGIINVLGGVGILIATLGLGWLYRINHAGPFVVAAVLLVATTLLLAAVLPRLTERYAVQDEAPDDGKPATNSLRMLRDVVADNWRGVPLLLLSIVLYTFGINAVETFFSLYGRTVLGIREETALSILGVFFITYIIASVPAGAVGQRFGRRQTMSVGLALISLLILGAFVLRSVPALLVVMPLGGVAWALVNTNALPAVLGMSPAGHAASTVGLYYAATTLASILSPVVNGRLIDLGGGDYNLAILSTSIVAGLAALVLVAMGRMRAASGDR
jgi:Na+/melibiose symporter-like transporter